MAAQVALLRIIHKGCFNNIRATECQKHLVQFKFWEVNKATIKWTTNAFSYFIINGLKIQVQMCGQPQLLC